MARPRPSRLGVDVTEPSDDHAVRLTVPRAMQAALPCDPVILLNSDHSPFFSSASEAPNNALVGIAEIWDRCSVTETSLQDSNLGAAGLVFNLPPPAD